MYGFKMTRINWNYIKFSWAVYSESGKREILALTGKQINHWLLQFIASLPSKCFCLHLHTRYNYMRTCGSCQKYTLSMLIYYRPLVNTPFQPNSITTISITFLPPSCRARRYVLRTQSGYKFLTDVWSNFIETLFDERSSDWRFHSAMPRMTSPFSRASHKW